MSGNTEPTAGQSLLEQLRHVQQGSSQWHHARATRLTASDVPKVLGISPHGDRQTLRIEKQNCLLQGPTASTAAQLRGINEEQLIVDWFLENCPLESPVVSCRTTGLWLHPTETWFGASPDRLLVAEDGSKCLLEVKYLHQLPEDTTYIYCQVHAQLLVMDASGWFPGNQVPAAFVCVKTHDGSHHILDVAVLDASVRFVWHNRMLAMKEYHRHFLAPLSIASTDAGSTVPAAAAKAAAAAAAAAADDNVAAVTPSKQQREQGQIAADYTPGIKIGKPVLHCKKGTQSGTVVGDVVNGKVKVHWEGSLRAMPVACAHLRVQPLKKDTQQVLPTAEQQRVLVVGGEYAGSHGTVKEVHKLRCTVQLDTTEIVKLERKNLHTASIEEPGQEPDPLAHVVAAHELDHYPLTTTEDFGDLLDKLTEKVDLLKQRHSWGKIQAGLQAIITASAELSKQPSTLTAGQQQVPADDGSSNLPAAGIAAAATIAAAASQQKAPVASVAARTTACAAETDGFAGSSGAGATAVVATTAAAAGCAGVELEDIRFKLQQGLRNPKGRTIFSVSFGCVRAAALKPSSRPEHKVARPSKKVGCRYHLRIEVRQYPQQLVIVPVQCSPHTGHDPDSAEEQIDREIDSKLADRCMELLQLGIRPFEVMLRMDKEADDRVPDEQYIDSYTGRNRRLSWRDVRNLAKRVARAKMIDSNDVAAVTSIPSHNMPQNLPKDRNAHVNAAVYNHNLQLM